MLALPAPRSPGSPRIAYLRLVLPGLIFFGVLDSLRAQEVIVGDGYPIQHPAPYAPSYGPPLFSSFGGWPPIYTRAEGLAWWTDRADYGTLVTTSIPAPTDPTNAGALGQPGTTVLFGGQAADDVRSGVRAELGIWLNSCRSVGIEAAYTGLAEWSSDYSANSQSNAVLARPFAATSGAMESHLIAFPGVVDGSVAVNTTTRLDSLELSYRRIFRPAPSLHWDFLIGYRHSRLEDSLSIAESLVSLDDSSGQPAGTTTTLSDLFSADNRFNGVQFGLVSSTRCGQLGLELSSRLALGDTRTKVTIDGSQTVTMDGVATTSPNGLLAQPTNNGVYESSAFAVIPDLAVNLRYNITNHTSLTVGYRVVYWSSVGRAADQIDPVLNLSQVPPGALTGSARPDFQLIRSGFWAQGATAGLDIRF